MNSPLNQRKEESLAKELLSQYLNSLSLDNDVRINPSDPPDILINFPDRTPWGVEVVRVYEKVSAIGAHGETASSETVFRYLDNFGRTIRDATQTKRRRNYVLYLEGPGGIGSVAGKLKAQAPRDWKRRTLELISEHIHHDTAEILRGPGFNLRPGGPGSDLRVFVGSGTHATGPALEAALKTTLDDKAKDLPFWKIECSHRWLLMLNCYILAEDALALSQIQDWLLAINNGFHGVFWSGFAERGLIAVQRE